MIKILAISGSLRSISTNSTLLRACRLLAPQNLEINLYTGLGDLPLFNPDIEGPNFERPPPPPVKAFREQLRAADAYLIASPEYAHGVTGVIKNALDWLVASGEFVDKPVASLNASPRASIAQENLRETMMVMGGIIDTQASITIALLGEDIDEQGIIEHPQMAEPLRTALQAFADTIQAHQEKMALVS